MSERRREWSITLRNDGDQAAFTTMLRVLTDTLGLDWKGMPGEPDGAEVALECAEALWRVGFRTTDQWRA